MALFRKKYPLTIEQTLETYFVFKNETTSLEPLIVLFESVKQYGFSYFLSFLEIHPQLRANLAHYLKNIFEGKKISLVLTEANILSENAFLPELKKRIISKMLPAIENEDTVSYILEKVLLNSKKNFGFLLKIKPQDWQKFFNLLNFSTLAANKVVQKDLLLSINILVWRAIGNALNVDVLKMAPEYKNFDNPFIALQNEMDYLVENFQKSPSSVLSSKNEHYKQAKIYLKQCLEFINIAFKNTSKYGISSKTNQSLMMIRQQLVRISEILPLLVIDSPEDEGEKSVTLVRNILTYKSHRNNFRELFAESTLQISHLITSHTAQTGSHYIAINKKQYFNMFKKAAGGGIIVGFLCVLKMLYGYSHGSEFTHAVLYSFNYAMGFILIYLLHYTLATKQPAMTATTMAKVLSEERNTTKNYTEFAHLVAQLFRTQFIAFVGNVLLAFPIALAIIYGLDILLTQNLATDKAELLLRNLNPFESKAILHACIAGIFLFISGIIAGNVANNSRFYQIPERIAKNPYLNKTFGPTISRNISVFYAKNWAGIISNFWFGIFMGVTAPVGHFLGLDLDIRHITFSAGNFALGLYGKGFQIGIYTFSISIITIAIIGFCNFIVSFGLAMSLAFRSRKINSVEVSLIYKEIFRSFTKNPLKFFIPIKSDLDETADQMMKEGIGKEGKDKTPIKKINL